MSSIGFCVADRPTRCRRRPASASRRSSDSARWLPRLSRATAWISSTITVRTLRSISRARSEVRIRYNDSGVVTRMCGGRFTIAWRSAAGVSPVRTSVRIATSGRPSSPSVRPISASGSERFFWMSLERALSGET